VAVALEAQRLHADPSRRSLRGRIARGLRLGGERALEVPPAAADDGSGSDGPQTSGPKPRLS
ncbi:MAG TPA: hypothetical protein VNS99_11055, partial [Gaiellales bacterium]|nr:hypothetical protein [Gaiellales bacterium]